MGEVIAGVLEPNVAISTFGKLANLGGKQHCLRKLMCKFVVLSHQDVFVMSISCAGCDFLCYSNLTHCMIIRVNLFQTCTKP